MEQRLRCETEQRLTQHLSSLIGITITEHVEGVRQQIIEERLQRQVDMSTLRSSLESTKSLGQSSIPENLKECVRSEVNGTVELDSDQLKKMGGIDLALSSQLAELQLLLKENSNNLAAQLKVLESCPSELPSDASMSPKSPGKSGLRLDHQVQELRRCMDTWEERLENFSSQVQACSNPELGEQSLQGQDDARCHRRFASSAVVKQPSSRCPPLPPAQSCLKAPAGIGMDRVLPVPPVQASHSLRQPTGPAPPTQLSQSPLTRSRSIQQLTGPENPCHPSEPPVMASGGARQAMMLDHPCHPCQTPSLLSRQQSAGSFKFEARQKVRCPSPMPANAVVRVRSPAACLQRKC